MKPLVLWIAAWAILPAWSASFDCGKASTGTEITICADKELSELDDEMAAQYRHVVARHPDPALIRERQRAWLTERNRGAGAPTCLKRLYGARIEELEGNATAFRQDTGLKFEHVDRRPEPSSAPPKTEAERKARQRASRVGG